MISFGVKWFCEKKNVTEEAILEGFLHKKPILSKVTFKMVASSAQTKTHNNKS